MFTSTHHYLVSYFAQFVGFTPSLDAGFLSQFGSLAVHQGWSRQGQAHYQAEAIEAEFDDLYGTDTSSLAA